MDGVRICLISPPEFDVSTAALFSAWIAGDPLERLVAIAREYYEKGPLPTNTNYVPGLSTASSAGFGPTPASSNKQRDDGSSPGGTEQTTADHEDDYSHPQPHSPRSAHQHDELADITSTQLTFRRTRGSHYIDATTDLLRSSIHDDVRTFEALEHYLCTPTLLKSQTMIQIHSPRAQAFVIERYWSLDDVVVREMVLGSKRLARGRKDLDDVSESTGIPLRSVTRQFDNLKRLYTAVEDNEKCNLFDLVQRTALLTPLLSRKYACNLFLLYSKFALTSKKRMARVSLKGLELCAALTLACLVSDCGTFYRVARMGAGVVGLGSSGESGSHRGDIVNLSAAGASSRTHSGSVSSNTASPSNLGVVTGASNINNANNSSSSNPSFGTISNSPAEGHEPDEASGSTRNPAFTGASAKSVGELNNPGPGSSSPGLNPVPEMSDKQLCDLLSTGDPAQCWSVIWSVFSHVEAVDADKQLMNNLRDLKTTLTGDKLNAGVQHVMAALSERPSGPQILKRIDSTRLRTVLKAILQIGANLSQTREYRDFFEDILTKVAEPLEECNLSLNDINTLLVCCASVVKAIPDAPRSSSLSSIQSSNTSNERLDRKKDWTRFMLCCRLVLIQLVQGS